MKDINEIIKYWQSRISNINIVDDFLITFEGIDGTGKSSCSKIISKIFNIPIVEKGLSEDLGVKGYIEKRDKINLFKNNETVDFYIDSYKKVSNYSAVIADRYLGSLYAWGIDKNNRNYFIERLAELRQPTIGILFTGDPNIIAKRISTRTKEGDDSYKAHLAKRHHSKHIEIYKQLNIDIIEIDTTTLDIEQVIWTIMKKLLVLLDSSTDVALQHFKFPSNLMTFGFNEIENNVYQNKKAIFDVNLKTYTHNEVSVYVKTKKQFFTAFLHWLLVSSNLKINMCNNALKYNDKTIHINTLLQSNINVDIDGGYLYINWQNIPIEIENILKLLSSEHDFKGDQFIDSSIEEIHIGKNVKQLGDNPFAGIVLKTIKIDSSRFVMNGDFLIDNHLKKAIHYNSNCDKVVIPEGIEILGKHLFYKKNLKEVIIPSTVKIIMNNPFSHSTNVQVINKSPNFNAYDWAIYNKFNTTLLSVFTDVKDVKLIESTEKIGKNSFYKRNKLETLQLNKKLKYIGHNPFVDMLSNFKISIDNENINFNIFKGGLIWNKTFLIKQVEQADTMVIDNTYSIIGRNSFSGLEHIKKISFKNEITLVQRGAFQNMKSLEEVNFVTQPQIEAKNPKTIMKWGK